MSKFIGQIKNHKEHFFKPEKLRLGCFCYFFLAHKLWGYLIMFTYNALINDEVCPFS